MPPATGNVLYRSLTVNSPISLKELHDSLLFFFKKTIQMGRGFKSKRQLAGVENINETQDIRRTRASEKVIVEHLHSELLKQAERIEQLTAGIARKKQVEGTLRVSLSAAKDELKETIDAYGGPMRRMWNQVCKLKVKIRLMSSTRIKSNDTDAVSGDESAESSSSSSEDSGVEDGFAAPLTRKRPKCGSYNKKGGADAAQSAIDKYQQRKLKEFETAVDKLFSNALGTLSSHVDGECSPDTKESRRCGSEAFKWVLHMLMINNPERWAHLLREKRRIQEAKKAAMDRIRKHW